MPGQAIYSRGCGTYSRWQSHLHTYPVDDCSCEAALLTTLRVVLTEIHRSVLVGGGLLESRPAYLIPADVSEAHACDVCGQYFPSEGIMQWHREHAHRVRKLPPKQYQRDFDFFERSVDGRPECRHCRAVLNSARELMRHISLGRCTVLFQTPLNGRAFKHPTPEERAQAPAPPADLPFIQQSEHILRFSEQGLDYLLTQPAVCSELKDRCCLCRLNVTSSCIKTPFAVAIRLLGLLTPL